MQLPDLLCMIFVLLVLDGICVGYTYQLFLTKDGLLAIRTWKCMLYPWERCLMLLLAPLTVLVYALCSLFSGLRFGDWVERKLEARIAATRQKHPHVPDPSVPEYF